MRVTYHGDDYEVTVDPAVDGPRAILYDYDGRPLKRPIGFRPGLDDRLRRSENDQRSFDNRPQSRVNSKIHERTKIVRN